MAVQRLVPLAPVAQSSVFIFSNLNKILSQELKKEIKTLEGRNEKLDFIQKTWQSNGLTLEPAAPDPLELLCV